LGGLVRSSSDAPVRGNV